jgi:hypothetical protein
MGSASMLTSTQLNSNGVVSHAARLVKINDLWDLDLGGGGRAKAISALAARVVAVPARPLIQPIFRRTSGQF